MQIAIDGPAGAGKSTVAKEVASELHLKYVDTGATYRALAVALARAGIDTKDTEAVVAALPSLKMEIGYDGDEQYVLVNGTVMDGLRTAEAALSASDVAVVPQVREELVEVQREAARNFDVIMDGRDIGSYVLPDADFKFYFTATPRARAERRRRDLLKLGRDVDIDVIEAEIAERDAQDMNRKVAPLRETSDQIVIDTTDMSQQEAVQKMLAIIRGEE